MATTVRALVGCVLVSIVLYAACCEGAPRWGSSGRGQSARQGGRRGNIALQGNIPDQPQGVMPVQPQGYGPGFIRRQNGYRQQLECRSRRLNGVCSMTASDGTVTPTRECRFDATCTNGPHTILGVPTAVEGVDELMQNIVQVTLCAHPETSGLLPRAGYPYSIPATRDDEDVCLILSDGAEVENRPCSGDGICTTGPHFVNGETLYTCCDPTIDELPSVIIVEDSEPVDENIIDPVVETEPSIDTESEETEDTEEAIPL